MTNMHIHSTHYLIKSSTDHLITVPPLSLCFEAKDTLTTRNNYDYQALKNIEKMGQLITRHFTRGIEKQDVNLDYETYGREGDLDYATDYNGEL